MLNYFSIHFDFPTSELSDPSILRLTRPYSQINCRSEQLNACYDARFQNSHREKPGRICKRILGRYRLHSPESILLRSLRAVSATRSYHDRSDLLISCALLVGAYKFNDCFGEPSIDVVIGRLWPLSRGHYLIKRSPCANL